MKKWVFLLIFALILFGCSRIDMEHLYGDLLIVDGIAYVCCNVGIPDEGIIGKQISQVENKITENSNMIKSQLKNCDSINLKKGTLIYEITGIEIKDMVAAKLKKDKYAVYMNIEKSDEIISNMKREIKYAKSVIIKDSRRKYLEITDSDIIESIAESILTTEDWNEDVDGFDRFYTLEFIVSDENGSYKPSLNIVYRTNETSQYGIIFENGIKKTDFDVKKLLMKYR